MRADAITTGAPEAVSTAGEARRGSLTSWLPRLFAPSDIASLVVARVAFGAIMLYEVWRYFSNDWIYAYYIEPTFYFSYFGFDWVKPWPGDGMYIHFFALGVLSTFIMIGFLYRLSATLFFLGFSYVFLLDETRYLNHFYLICLLAFLLIFLPTHRAFSVDSTIRPQIESTTVPAWALWTLRAQVGIAYFFAGVAKINGDWLQGEPMRMWLADRAHFPIVGPFFTQEWVVYLFSYGGLLFDLLVVPALLWHRTRPYAFVLAIGFHLMNASLFSIGIFPWLMIVATTLFFPPDWPRRFLPFLRTQHTGAACPIKLSRRQVGIALALGLYFLGQVLMPLRHFLYPGDPNWTEEGHRFSWHMKLRTKGGTATFFATDPDRNITWEISPADYLTSRQRDVMDTHPDMILQFAHYLARELRARGHPNIEIRARAMVTLNGRPRVPMVNERVDLAKESRSLLPSDWIIPLREPLVAAGP
jgi:vitamin K-dependent gamma-carboxylase